MRGIVERLLKKNPRVRVCANAVTLESVAELSEIAKTFGYTDIAAVSVARPRALGRHHLITAQNPCAYSPFGTMNETTHRKES